MRRSRRSIGLCAIAACAGLLSLRSGRAERKPPTPIALPTLIQVGPSRTIKTPSQAAAIARHGDIIEIDTGTYVGDAAVWRADNLTITGVGGRARLLAAGESAEGKAIWVIKGRDATVKNIEFAEAEVPAGNGAGIRAEGTT